MEKTKESKTTKDHEVIRIWAEERNGFPARIRGVVGEDDLSEGGILRIDFNEPLEELERISWETFFEIFDSKNLVFLYQDETVDGETSRFFKFISEETAETV